MNRINTPLTSKPRRARHDVHIMRGSSSSSLAHVRVARVVCALPFVSLCIVFMAQSAFAATWPMSTSALSATLAFHQSYSAGSNSYVHSGIDIPASAGLQIISPLAGTVRFTGAVPSGDSRTGGTSSDKTMNAVSIELADGRTVTLMPFASIGVREGQVVAEGAPLGTLAASGDVSTSATHLHMGYKQGSRYLDPMLLFGVASDAPSGAAATQSVAEAPAASAPTPLADAEPAPSVGELAGSSVCLEQSDVARAPEESAGVSSEPFGAIETGGYELAPQGASTSAGFLVEAFGWLGDACAGQFAGMVEALFGVSCSKEMAFIVLLAAMGALLLACVAYVRRHWSQLQSRLHTWKDSLSSPDGGGSMQKLFPASGAAFMSRSRIAQRR